MGIFTKRSSTHFHRDREGKVTGVTRTGDEPVESIRERMTKKEHAEVLEDEEGNVRFRRDGVMDDEDQGSGKSFDEAVEEFEEEDKLKKRQEKYEKKKEKVEGKVKEVEEKLGKRKRVAKAKLDLAKTKKELKDIQRAERQEKYKPLLSLAQGAKNMGLAISAGEKSDRAGRGGLGSNFDLDVMHGEQGGRSEDFFSFKKSEGLFDFSTKKETSTGGIGGGILSIGLNKDDNKFDFSRRGNDFTLAIGGGHTLSSRKPHKSPSKKKKGRSPPKSKPKMIKHKKTLKPKPVKKKVSKPVPKKHKKKSAPSKKTHKKRRKPQQRSSGRTEYILPIGGGMKL